MLAFSLEDESELSLPIGTDLSSNFSNEHSEGSCGCHMTKLVITDDKDDDSNTLNAKLSFKMVFNGLQRIG